MTDNHSVVIFFLPGNTINTNSISQKAEIFVESDFASSKEQLTTVQNKVSAPIFLSISAFCLA
jgi:hypothetical protein